MSILRISKYTKVVGKDIPCAPSSSVAESPDPPPPSPCTAPASMPRSWRAGRLDPGDTGSFLTLAPNGVDALDTLGVLDRVRADAVPSRRNAMYGATGTAARHRHPGPAHRRRHPGPDPAPLPDRGGGARGSEGGRGDDAVRRSRAGGRPGGRGGHPGGRQRPRGRPGRGRRRRALPRPRGDRPGARRSPATSACGTSAGITRATPEAAGLAPEQWHFVFGRQAFFGAHPTPAGDVLWFVNVPGPELSREERTARTTEEWRRAPGRPARRRRRARGRAGAHG